MTQSCSDTMCRQQQLSVQPYSKQLPLQGTPFTRSLLQTVQASVLLQQPGQQLQQQYIGRRAVKKGELLGMDIAGNLTVSHPAAQVICCAHPRHMSRSQTMQAWDVIADFPLFDCCL